LIGWLLISGLVAFMVGAVRWRLEYEQPFELSLPLKASDTGRLRWIHYWMSVGVGLNSTGVAAIAMFTQSPWGAAAAVLFVTGATSWLIAIAFRLTVGEWAAAEMVATGMVPSLYPALAAWSGGLHALHMMTAYLSAVPLGWMIVAADLGPAWFGWAGMVWGATFAFGFALTRGGAFFSPPFWAHLFTGALGLTLLLS
jgi:hypothetical protein